MDKLKILAQILDQLSKESEALRQAARIAHDAATHEESRAEDQHDTRALEASYLAAGQATRVDEIEKALTLLKLLNLKTFTSKDAIQIGALVGLKTGNLKHYFFILPKAGGLILKEADTEVQVITPHSPLGDALIGKFLGEEIEVELKKQIKTYEIVSII